MNQNIFIYAPKIVFDFLFDIVYFLPWWYGKGLLSTFAGAWNFIRDKEQGLAILVWLKNITKPMYEDYGWKNSLKSVILRIGQILLRFVILALWSLVAFLGLALYAILPVLVIWQIIYQSV